MAILLPFPFSLIIIPKASLWKLQNNGSAICACVAVCTLIVIRVPSLRGAAEESRRSSLSAAALPSSPPVLCHHSHPPSPKHEDSMEYLTRNDHPKVNYVCPEAPKTQRCSSARRGDVDLYLWGTHVVLTECLFVWGGFGGLVETRRHSPPCHCTVATLPP